MSRQTVKTSTIFVSVGKKTRVYSSVDEVPPTLRRKLEEATNGLNAATILIADRRGREEILKAIETLPIAMRSRLTASLLTTGPKPEPTKPTVGFFRKYWLEMLLPAVVAAIIWFAFHSAR